MSGRVCRKGVETCFSQGGDKQPPLAPPREVLGAVAGELVQGPLLPGLRAGEGSAEWGEVGGR